MFSLMDAYVRFVEKGVRRRERSSLYDVQDDVQSEEVA